eukprot:3941050-Rhodomonas_salina.2
MAGTEIACAVRRVHKEALDTCAADIKVKKDERERRERRERWTAQETDAGTDTDTDTDSEKEQGLKTTIGIRPEAFEP